MTAFTAACVCAFAVSAGAPTPAGETIAGQGLTMHVLKAGMTLDLGR
ncbi:MAG: hypothetical protein ACM3NQ_24720 [Bacteroidales bacterium]